MKFQFLTLITYALTAGVAMADAVALQGQQYMEGVDYYTTHGGFLNVQFKSNAYEGWTLNDDTWKEIDKWPGYDSSSKNLLEDVNDFSISMEIEDLLFTPEYPIYSFISSADGAHGLSVALIQSGNAFHWAISQEGSTTADNTPTLGAVYDGKLDGTYVFRSGADFMDLWHVGDDGESELLVTHNEALDGALYGYLCSNTFENSIVSNANIMLGQVETDFLTYNQISNATLYNGLYTADGVGSLSPDVDVVPEPTTATLSLLALAGLAARRRRK